MNCNLSLNIRADILLQAQAGIKYENIVENVAHDHKKNISKGIITKIRDKYDDTNTLIDKPRPGRPKLLEPEEEKAIIRAVKKDPKLTAVDIYNDPELNQPNASIRTIQYLLKEYGLEATTTQPQKLSPEAIEQRLAFANKYMNEPDIWPKIVFSDESDLYPYKAGKLFIRRCRGEYPLSYYNMNTRWDERTVKVWGCISIEGVGPLVRYSGTMENTKLIEIYESQLIKNYPKLRGSSTRPGALLFQQDNAGPHRHNNVARWFKENKVCKIFWPPYSPDLNPLENVWGILQDELYKYNDDLETSEDVWEVAQEIWKKDINSCIPKLYKSLPDRMLEVIERSGGRIDR